MSEEKDPIIDLIAEARTNRNRLRAKPPTTVPAIASEIDGTVLSLVEDALGQVYQLREYVFSAVADLESRIDDEEGTRLEPDDAEKIKALIGSSKWLVQLILQSPQTPEVAAKLKEVLTLADECAKIVDETVSEDEEGPEDEEEEGEEEDDGEAAATGATP